MLAAASLVAGCLSPTLPLPPPNEPEVVSGPTEQGLVRLQGKVPANSWVFALNHNSDLAFAQGTHEDGLYDFEIKAQVGDNVSLWYELSGDASDTLDFTIEQPKQ